MKKIIKLMTALSLLQHHLLHRVFLQMRIQNFAL